MALSLGKIELFLGPQAAGAPDDLETPIVEAINSATKTAYLCSQQLESKPVINALIDARKRGVRIRVILERDYLLSRSPRAEPWEPGGSNEDNRESLSALFRTKIDARIDRSYRTLHNNFILIDHRVRDLATVLAAWHLSMLVIYSNRCSTGIPAH